MRLCRSGLIVAAVVLGNSGSAVLAQTESERAARCADWIAKKGYSRDYIEQRLGTRPPSRNRWHDNIRPDELQIGDVVAVTLWPGHVALVEEIVRDHEGKPQRMRVSSFNYGHGQGWIDRSCDVTVKFGVETSHWISLADAVGYWRPKPASIRQPKS